jgi:hypothetical protein
MDEIERGDTGVRLLYTLLFIVVARVVETVLLVVIIFELLFAWITRQPPGEAVRRFANRTISYFYRIGRYLTYNDAQPPFPFAEFPEEVEEIPALEAGGDEDLDEDED